MLLVLAPFLVAVPAAAQPGGLPRGIVSMTFDDGLASTYTNGLPILDSFGIKTTQYIITGFVDNDPNYVTTTDLQDYVNKGMELGSHTVDHLYLTTLTPAQVDYQLSASQAWIQQRFGPCPDFSIPFDDYNDSVIQAIKTYYLSARSSDPGFNTKFNLYYYDILVQTVYNTTTAAQVQQWVQTAIDDHSWLVLEYHGVDNSGSEYTTTPANLTAECQFIQQSGIASETVRQAITEIAPYLDQYSVTASVQGGNGTVSPLSQSVWYADSASVNMLADPGYKVSAIVDNGTGQPVANPYVLSNVAANHSIVVAFSPATPVVTSLSKDRGPPGSTIVVSGENFLASQGSSTVAFGGVPVASYLSWSNTSIEVAVPAGAISGPVTVTTDGGRSNADKTFSIAQPTWYLAEGSTRWGFSTYVTIENPNSSVAHAAVTYMTPDGTVSGGTLPLPAMSQTTVNPVVTLGAQDFSTRIHCEEGLNIAVDRTMIWSSPSGQPGDAHSSVGVAAPSTTCYLAEGSSNWGFECWLLIQNPNPGAATCSVTYMYAGGGSATVKKVVPGGSRSSYSMADDVGQKDASIRVESSVPVICERSMYRYGRTTATNSIGAETPANRFLLSEGTTGYGFTTYVLVQNPSSSSNTVTVTYLTPRGPVTQTPFMMSPMSRKTIDVNSALPVTDFSTDVSGTQPIVAERAMYWNGPDGQAGHDSIGTASAHMQWSLPDGQDSAGRETYTLVANPNTSPVNVQVKYLPAGGGGIKQETVTLAARTRRTFNMADSGLIGRASVHVVSLSPGKPIVVERSIYWNSRGAGTCTIGCPTD
jgi:hypothetical protein